MEATTRKHILRGGAGLLASALLAAVASAQTTFEFSVQPRTFRVCRLMVPVQAGGGWMTQPSDNYSTIFEGLRRFPDKPAGLELTNPLAPDGVHKWQPTYWEVPTAGQPIDPNGPHNAPDLRGFDLIYIRAPQVNLAPGLWPRWREALLQAVQDGAVLWIDVDHTTGCDVQDLAPPGSMLPSTPPAPFVFSVAPQTQGCYRRAYAGVWQAASGDLTRQLAERLLQYPFVLQEWQDIQYIGLYPQGPNRGTAPTDPIPPTQAESASPDAVQAAMGTALRPVVVVWNGSAWLNNVMVGRFGAGAIVLSASDVGYDIVNWWQGAHRLRPLQHEAADCKFGWNVLALAQLFAERGGSSSGSAANPAAIMPPLGIAWQYPDRFENGAPIGSVVCSPVVGRNLTFVVALGRPGGALPSVPPRLLAFDSEPWRDLDDDGRADDGMPDYALGRSYDLVWVRDLNPLWTPRWSSPTVATVNGIEIVLVSLTQVEPGNGAEGQVVAFRANDGQPLWTRGIAPYSGATRVVDLSTPTVWGDWVFVLASEMGDVDAGSGPEDTFGRAHCFQLSYNWAADQNGPQWVFPDASDNPNGDADIAGGNPTDRSEPEPARCLPPFQDPFWVAGVPPYDPRPELPPFPTAKPTLTMPYPPSRDAGCEVLLCCASPISLRKAASGWGVDNDLVVGGSDWLLVPTPKEATGTDRLNGRYYKVWLPAATALQDAGGNPLVQIEGPGIVQRPDEPNITATVTGLWQDPVDGRVYAFLRSGEAREYLLPALNHNIHFLELTQKGIGIEIPYKVRPDAGIGWNAVPTLTATAKLPPPVAQVVTTGGPSERRSSSATIYRGQSLVTSDCVEDNSGTLKHNDYATPTRVPPAPGPYDETGRIRAIDHATGETRWEVNPEALNLGRQNTQTAAPGGVAVEPETGTAVAAITSRINPTPGFMGAVQPTILGLNAEPRLRVVLREGPPAAELRAGAPVQIRTINAGGTGIVDVPAEAFSVDSATRTIEFALAKAGWVDDAVGTLYGKPVWITYTRIDPAQPDDPSRDVTVTNELHILPDIVRFQYMPWLVRLNHPLVRADANLSFSLPNGTPLVRASTALDSPTIAAASLPNMPAGWGAVWPRAILEVSDLQMLGGERLRPGMEFVVTYEFLDPVTLTPQTARERYQVPVNFGASVASPVVAGHNVHIGTEGYLPTGERGNPLWNPELWGPGQQPTPAQYTGTFRSFLSVVLDPITKAVRGALAQAALPNADTFSAAAGAPIVSGAAAIEGEGVLVGARLMRRLSQVAAAAQGGYQGEDIGFVSRLQTERTLICDTTRLVETVGGKLAWVCLGTLAPQYHASLEPLNLGNQELKATPFSRPAKAIYLPNGNILVADTGNNRVVEIDRRGRQVWPLDANGYDYYTSPARTDDFTLSRPADCFRYYVEYDGAGGKRSSRHGNLLPLQVDPNNPLDESRWRGTVAHTVIADTGHSRVLDVATIVTPLGVQIHRVEVVTPKRVRLPQGLVRLSYTRAIPIFEPEAAATPDNISPVIGYLCAAANLHQLVIVEAGTKRVDPGASQQPARGHAGTNWRWLAWVYDDDVTDANDAPTNPLIFRNIRDVQLAYEGPRAYVTVTCEQYAGRLADINARKTHWLAGQGAGIFEFALNIGGAAGSWARYSATDVAGGAPVTADDPIWYFNNLDYTYEQYTYDYTARRLTNGTRRTLTNIQYRDPKDPTRTPWLEMPWNPVACIRLPADQRVLTINGNPARVVRHLITNQTAIIQNLRRENIAEISLTAPAMIMPSVFVVTSDDRNDAAPENDLHELDRREVVPDPHEPDWTDPLNQPAYADRR